MSKRLFGIFTIILSSLFVSCDDGESRYTSDYVCNFIFYITYHPTSVLARVLDNPGMYVRVEVTKSLGIYHLLVYPNDGSDYEDIALTTALENEKISYDYVGADGAIIIGCSTAMEWQAYDAQCPACLENYTGTSYPLSWSDNGTSVTCSKCSRTYYLVHGASDDGYRLLEYYITSSGSVIVVRNG